jgi:LuxR family transcriptional regulator, maltose regulon positive regulatory protein
LASPLVETKLFIPRLRRSMVARPRLSGRLSHAAEARLTLISAPAGFGKTTLLTAWLAAATPDNRAVAWLSLDESDRQPATFWTYVITALQAAVPGVGADVLPLLQSAQPPIETVIVSVLNELSATPNDVVLVLDDYHLVDGPDLRVGMVFLLEHLPPHVHVVISSRADPLLPLARLRARGELVEVRAADLRFTPDEVAGYLNDVTGLDLAPDDIAALEGRTEGWIAALQLAAISMQGRTDIGGFIAQFAGNDRYIVDYLVEEVLTQQTDPVREFLLHTAVLDRLTGPLCDAVTGRDDGSQLLIALERANLFLVPLDDRREWYRYHHLFADVLRAHLLAGRPDLVPLLHQRASLWYERHNHTEEAVRHALAARDFDRAAYLMELAAPAIRRHRQEAVLFGWLEELPDAAVRRSPVLSVFYGYMLMISGDLAGFEGRLDDAEHALAAVKDEETPWADTEELQTLPATIAIYRASLAQARGDVAGTAEYARRALDFAGPDDHLARGGALGFLGLAAWVAGDVTAALETFTQAVASLHAAGNLVDELSSTIPLADMWLAAGRPSRARRLYQGALRLAEAHGGGVARATTELHVGVSEIDLEIDDIESTKRELQTAAALGEPASTSAGRYRWFLAMGRVADAEGDPLEAITLLDQAQQLYLPGLFPGVRPISAVKARVWISRGDLSQAADWAQERGVSATDDANYLHEFDHLTLVRLLIAQYRVDHHTDVLDQAAGLLDRLADAAETSGRAGSLLEIRMVQALAHHAQGHRAQALQSLAQAWAEAPEPDGYVRLFLDEGAHMVELLREAEQLGGAGGHARRLLTRRAAGDGEATESPLRPALSLALPSAEVLSERELQVLRLLGSELSGPQIARELFVSNNTLRSHTKHIFTKLDVTNRRAAVRRAREEGLI